MTIITKQSLESLQLSQNFTAAELCASLMAEAEGLENVPTIEQLLNLGMVTQMCLQPVRSHFDTPIPKYSGITSGFRSRELNRLVGSNERSDHLHGRAIDFQVPGLNNMAVARWMMRTLTFDQLILERHGNGEMPNKGWIHVSYRTFNTNRNQVFTYDGKTYAEGLHFYHDRGL